MNVLNQHLDILQNIEATAIAFCRENPVLKDAHILAVYEKLLSLFDRRKRKLPELPVALPPISMSLFLELKTVCETRIAGSPSEMPGAVNVPPGVMVLCLKKLVDSVKRWTKEGGVKGYIQFVEKYLP